MKLNNQIVITAIVASLSICLAISIILVNERAAFQNQLNIFYTHNLFNFPNIPLVSKNLNNSSTSKDNGVLFEWMETLKRENSPLHYLYVMTKNGELITASAVDDRHISATNYQYNTVNGRNIAFVKKYYVNDRENRLYAKLLDNDTILYFGIDQQLLSGDVYFSSSWIYLLYVFSVLVVSIAAYYWGRRLTYFINISAGIVHSIATDDPQIYADKVDGIPEFKRLITSVESLSDAWKATLHESKNRERFLFTTLNSIADAVITTNADGLIISMNPVAEKLTGWSLTDAAGTNITHVYSIIDTATRTPIKNLIARVVCSNSIVNISKNAMLVDKAGQECRIENSAAPINDEGGVVGVVIVFHDITEQFNLREKSQEAAERLKGILNDMQTMLGLLDVDGKLVFANNLPLEITGVPLSEVLNKTFSDAIWFNFDVNVSLQIQHDVDANLAGESTSREMQVYTVSGLLWVLIAMHPVFDSEGRVKEVVVEGHDISSRKRTEEHLRRSQKMEALGKLTGGIAHDYNNMLGIIQGYAELLEDELVDSPEMSKYATQIIIASQRSVNLTRKLLNFSRKESGESDIVNLSDILLEQRNMLETSITLAILLEFSLAENLWRVQLEVGDFEDAILNLSINGMHAISEHKHGVIRYSSSNEFLITADAGALQLQEGEYVKIIVSDNGCGMSTETRQRIFEPFFTTKGDKGTGLGLSQVYSFVKRNNGSISVYSEEGRGTEFVMFFPRSHDQNLKQKAQNNAKESFLGSETILIVDDEPALTQLASEILSKQGYQVVVANSAKQALAVMEHSPVDLMISDIIMPEMDGYELANIVHEKYPRVKILMASGFTSESQLKENLTATRTILTKPYRKHTLINAVRDVLDAINGDDYTYEI